MTKQYQLLVANQTFVGFSRRPRRFRTVEPGFLPVFGKPASNATPMHSTAQHSAEHTACSGHFASQCELPLFAPKSAGVSCAPEPVVSIPEKPMARALEREAHAESNQGASADEKRGNWRFVLSSFWRRRNRQQPGVPLAQGELGLATVRVVRNDLSDADIEVVQASRASEHGSMRDKSSEHRTVSLIKRWFSRLNGPTALRGNA